MQNKHKKSDLKDFVRLQLATTVYRDIQANKDNIPYVKPQKRVISDNHASPVKNFY